MKLFCPYPNISSAVYKKIIQWALFMNHKQNIFLYKLLHLIHSKWDSLITNGLINDLLILNYLFHECEPWVMLCEHRFCASLAIFVLWSCELWFCLLPIAVVLQTLDGLNVAFLCTDGGNHRWPIISSTWHTQSPAAAESLKIQLVSALEFIRHK